MPVAILGMHRSGTSMVARLLQACGLDLGPEQDLMPSAPDNPEGFGENLKFVDLNEQVLAALGGGWDSPPADALGWERRAELDELVTRAELLVREFAGREPWGWKDPRNSLTLPLWSRVASPLTVVCCVRHPLEVALSLRRRNGLSIARGLKLWAEYYERVLATTVADSRIFTHYDAYFRSARSELRRVADFVGLSLDATGLERAAAVALPWLRHYRLNRSHLQRAEVPAKVDGLYRALCAEASFGDADDPPPGGPAPPASRDTGETGDLQLARGRPEIDERRTNVHKAQATTAALPAPAVGNGEIVKELRALRTELRSGVARADGLKHENRELELERGVESLRRRLEQETSRGARLAARCRDAVRETARLPRAAAERERLAHELAAREALLAETQAELTAFRANVEGREVELARLRAEAEAARLRDEELARLLGTAVAGEEPTGGANGGSAAAPPSHALYEDLVVRIRMEVAASLPDDATILVVSRGDEEILKLGRRTAWHFPQDESGQYAGYYPATSDEAIAQLEALRARGGQFILFPSTALWWLDHYAELRTHLESRYRLVLRNDDVCAVFMLDDDGQRMPVAAAAEARSALTGPVAELVRAKEELAARLEEAERRAEAHSRDRLARARLAAFLASGGTLEFPKAASPRTSIVIPSFHQAHLLLQTLESLRACFAEAEFELVVVDNASDGETQELLDRLVNVRVQRNGRNIGFGGACTLGAQLARGAYVCFLNNDTVVMPGWLRALVDTIESYPGCGAVGSKLIHADGRLQEGGGIVWRDGSGWGYGRGRDPQAPEVTYRREVDYCSAASLLVRRDLFVELGGFDERYAPAYYEDTDLCVAIWAAGYKVVYEPRSVVFHLEYGSSGEERAVAMHRRNQQKLAAKWESSLADRLPPAVENLARARDRRPARRILVADDRVPNSGRGSGFPRARALLEALVDLGFVVTFLPTTDPTPYQPETGELQQLGVEVLHGACDIEAALRERAALYDAAIVSRPHNAHLIEVVRRLNPKAAVVYDAEAVFAVREVLQAAVEGAVVPEAEAEGRIDAELDLMDGADVVVTVSEPERRLVRGRRPSRVVEVWGDSVRPRRVQHGFRARHDLLFVGGLGTPPNADAASYLLREIFPSVQRRLGCRLYVVGSSPAPALFDSPASFGEGVIFTGFVEDLDPVYDRSRVFVAPHRFAAGAPHKVIEAMAHGVPCVVSKLLADQLEVTDGEEALVASNAQGLAEQVTRLYRERRLWRRVQERAYRLVEERYDPDAMRLEVGRIVDAALASRTSAAPMRTELIA